MTYTVVVWVFVLKDRTISLIMKGKIPAFRYWQAFPTQDHYPTGSCYRPVAGVIRSRAALN